MRKKIRDIFSFFLKKRINKGQWTLKYCSVKGAGEEASLLGSTADGTAEILDAFGGGSNSITAGERTEH